LFLICYSIIFISTKISFFSPPPWRKYCKTMKMDHNPVRTLGKTTRNNSSTKARPLLESLLLILDPHVHNRPLAIRQAMMIYWNVCYTKSTGRWTGFDGTWSPGKFGILQDLIEMPMERTGDYVIFGQNYGNNSTTLRLILERRNTMFSDHYKYDDLECL
jgi:hypothetical protein